MDADQILLTLKQFPDVPSDGKGKNVVEVADKVADEENVTAASSSSVKMQNKRLVLAADGALVGAQSTPAIGSALKKKKKRRKHHHHYHHRHHHRKNGEKENEGERGEKKHHAHANGAGSGSGHHKRRKRASTSLSHSSLSAHGVKTRTRSGTSGRVRGKKMMKKKESPEHAVAASSSSAAASTSHNKSGVDEVPTTARGYRQLRKVKERQRFAFESDAVLLACKGKLPSDQLQRVYWMLHDCARNSNAELSEKLAAVYRRLCQDRVTEAAMSAKSSGKSDGGGWRGRLFGKSDGIYDVSFTKALLDFGLEDGAECPLNKTMRDSVTLTMVQSAHGSRLRYRWHPPKHLKSHQVRIEPMEGVMKKGAPVRFTFSLDVATTLLLEEVLVLELDGIGQFYFVIELQSEKSVFGVDPSELELVDDCGLPVPAVLATLGRFLHEHNGLDSEGIFRLAPDENETLAIKAQLNKGTFSHCSDVNCVANLVKVWYRELPTQLLNTLSADDLLAAETEEQCRAVFAMLEEPNHTLMQWLLRLLADTASRQQINKMSTRNLAIVISPNLFTSYDPNPLAALNLSQKVVNFLLHLINFELANK
jgi:RhoGAP domain